VQGRVGGLILAVMMTTGLAQAGPAMAADPDPADLARSIAADPAVVAGAEYVAKPPAEGAMADTTDPLAGFPTRGSGYGIMTTGSAALAFQPDTSESSGVDLGGGHVRGSTDQDVTILRIDLAVPAGTNCLSGLDFRFLSEEFSEYVGSQYNDAFIAELDDSTWTTSGSTIVAADNFAFDPDGNPISINAAGVTSMRAEYAAGTTYDGATPILTAATPITPGTHALYLSIFDQGDGIYDSAVLLDNLRFTRVADVERECRPGAELADNRKYVGLGDSYSSGFGVEPYEPGTHKDGTENDCQRSEKAFAPLIAARFGLELDFHACQGAVTRDFYEARAGGDWGELPQLEYLDPETGLVTFSIGGNDAGFADVMAECILGFELLPFNTCYNDDKVTEPVAAAFARLDGVSSDPADIVPYDTLYKDVRQVTPFAARVTVGYPPLFTAEGSDRTFLPGGRCEGVKKADQRWMVEVGAELNSIIERNALRNGFRYVDPSSRFVGHELCGEGDEWFDGILSGGRFHPTDNGHVAIADAIEEELERDDGPAFVVRSGETVDWSFIIDSILDLFSIISEWPGSDVEMTLISPSGVEYTRAAPGAGVYHANGPTWEQFEIPNPELGEWTVRLYGADVEPAGEEVRLSLHRRRPANQRPVARIDWRRSGGELVLHGGRSEDPDGSIASWDWYVWTDEDDLVKTGEEVRFDVADAARTVTLVVTDDEGLTDFAELTLAPMDIRPDSDENPLNPGATGRLPLALLSAPDLDATQVDTSTLRLGPGGSRVEPPHVHVEDVDGDGLDDLKMQFPIPPIGATDGMDRLCMQGELPDGRAFEACDRVRVVM